MKSNRQKIEHMTRKQMSRYRDLLARLERAEDLLLSMQESVGPTIPSADNKLTYGITKSPNKNDTVGNLIAEIENLKERVIYLKRGAEREKKKINRFVDTIHDDRVRIALRHKYINGATWWQVAEIFGVDYNDETIKKLCYRFLKRDSDGQQLAVN